MKFKMIAEVFDSIEKESGRTKITELLADLFKKASPHEASLIAYLSVGSLNPPYIGTQFNFAEKSLIKVLAHLLHKTGPDIKNHTHKLGDLGAVVETGSWDGGSDILSLIDVERVLQEFIEISGTGSQDVREQKMLKLLQAVDPISAKYIVRIVEGKLRLGFSDMTLLARPSLHGIWFIS